MGSGFLTGRRDAILHSDLSSLGWVFIPCMRHALGRFGIVVRGVLDLPSHLTGCATQGFYYGLSRNVDVVGIVCFPGNGCRVVMCLTV